jgi:hypothetical protein
MNALRTSIPALAALAAFALPAVAGAEEVVPPGNSAATQYTEAIPTAGGPKQTGSSQHHRQSSPAKVLGAHDAHKLDSKGEAGHAVAEFAAETAPVTSEGTTHRASAQAPQQQSASHTGGATSHQAGSGTPSASGGTGGGSGGSSASGGGSETASSPQGGSGAGAVLAKATGSSSAGGTQTLLPLALLATVAWAIVFVVRRRKQATT